MKLEGPALYEQLKTWSETPNPSSHELARLLLSLPDLPVASMANGHVYAGSESADRRTHGPLVVGLLRHYAGDHIGIGNALRMNINRPNWYLTRLFRGWAPRDYDSGSEWMEHFVPEDGECNP